VFNGSVEVLLDTLKHLPWAWARALDRFLGLFLERGPVDFLRLERSPEPIDVFA
jgi:hypothetical protein